MLRGSWYGVVIIVHTYVPYRTLRSADQALVVVPRIKLDRFGRRTFS